MLVILAPLFLFLMTLVGYVVYRVRNHMGLAWVIHVVITIFTFGFMVFLRFRLPTEFEVEGWRGFTTLVGGNIHFQADYISWSFAMTLMTMAMAFIFTVPARLASQSHPGIWTRALVVVSFGLLAVFSRNPLSIALAWTALDIVELILMMNSVTTARLRDQVVIMFGLRLGGTLALIWAMIISNGTGVPLELETMKPLISIFVLIGCGLRLGILPLNLPFTEEGLLRRGLGTVIRTVTSLSSLAVLARFPSQLIPEGWRAILLPLVICGMLYSGVMWFASTDELKGRPYFMISLAGLAVISVIQGHPDSVGVWTSAIMLSGIFFFLSTAGGTLWYILAGLSLIGMTGLPYTPAATGWNAIINGGFNLTAVAVFLVILFLILGCFKNIFREREIVTASDPVARIMYPVGLFILVVMQWLIGIFGGPQFGGVGVWWASTILVIFSLGIGTIWLIRRQLGKRINPESWIVIAGRRLGSIGSAVFGLRWIYQIIWWVLGLIERLVGFLTGVLEGDGGVLWALVLLALLLTLIQGGG